MKKLYLILLILTLSLLFGCSSNAPTQNSDSYDSSFGNVNNLDSIYTFINKNVADITSDEFNNNYTPYYFDINKDGHLDVCYNTEEWYGKLIFIASAENGYEIIKSDDNNMHKIESINTDDDFIIVCGQNINNGYGDNRTDIYIFNDNEIIFLNDFLISLSAGAQTFFEGEGTIEPINGYKEFKYIYKEYECSTDDYDNKKQHISVNMSYTFDEKNNTYITKETGKNYNTLTNSSSNSSSDSYNLISLKNGDKIEGFTINNIQYNDNSAAFSLIGQLTLDAYIGYNMEESCYSFYSENPILNKPIIIDWPYDNFSFEYKSIFGTIKNEEEILQSLPPSTRKYIEEGNEIKVSATIKNISADFKYQSEGFESVEILNFEVLDDGGSSNPNTIENLSGFKAETINDTYIDYSNYKCVIIPMNETQNSNSLSVTNLNYGSNQYPVFFNVLGSLHDVTVTYTENMDTEPVLIEHYDVINNSTVKICCKFETDFSHVGITGKVFTNSSEYEEVTFGLDDARDPSAYKIIMVK